MIIKTMIMYEVRKPRSIHSHFVNTKLVKVHFLENTLVKEDSGNLSIISQEEFNKLQEVK